MARAMIQSDLNRRKGCKFPQQMQGLAPGKKTPCHWGTGLLKRNWRSWQTGSWMWAISALAGKAAASGDPASGSREIINPCYSVLRPVLDPVARCQVPQHKTDKLESVQWRTTKMLRGLEHALWGEAEGIVLLSLEKRWLWGHLTALQTYKVVPEKTKRWSSLAVPGERTRHEGQKRKK